MLYFEFVLFTNMCNYFFRFCVTLPLLACFDGLFFLAPEGDDSFCASRRILSASSPNNLSNLLLFLGFAFTSVYATFLPRFLSCDLLLLPFFFAAEGLTDFLSGTYLPPENDGRTSQDGSFPMRSSLPASRSASLTRFAFSGFEY